MTNRFTLALVLALAMSCEQLIDAGYHYLPDGGEPADAGDDAGEDAGEDAGSDAGDSGVPDAGPADAGSGHCDGGPCDHWAWAVNFGDALPQEGLLLASGTNGVTAIAGDAAGYVDFGTGVLGTGELASMNYLAVMQPDASFVPRYANGYYPGGYPRAIAFSSDESVVMVGGFGHEISFDGGVLQSVNPSTSDIFLAKFDAQGQHVFSHSYGSPQSETVYDVAVGPSDEIVMVGQVGGLVDFGGGAHDAGGNTDLFIASYDSAGTHAWSQRLGNIMNQAAKSVAIQQNAFTGGEIVVVGDFGGQIYSPAGLMTSAGGQDIFMIYLDSFGNHLWTERYGDSADQHVTSVTVDTLTGAIAIAGTFQGTVNFGSGPMTSDGWDGFVATFSTMFEGSPNWGKQFGGPGDQECRDVAFDSVGNLVTVGSFRDTLTVGGQTRTSGGGSDLFVTKHDGYGTLVWVETAGDAADQELNAVAIDNWNRIRVTGTIGGTTWFDETPLTATGSSDILVGELKP